METKLFEIRDNHTFIPVLVVDYQPVSEKEEYLINKAGLGKGSTYTLQMTDLISMETNRDAYKWRDDRTKRIAHQYIEEKWKILKSGEVIDVEYILGETNTPKQSEFTKSN